ncbi:hypothetical protein GCM10027280_60070 [Micromonospora polyrhachis]|uniref:Uncharacterized protein n=1 Tax=Micromonospora polyrhachis TaxID=1282883 RepID=A0A7W7SN77_9ACTN|nr:SitI3 family protein [Micromonospora polyrhachis]MBB4957893.1 hypothetical protein [Micromonospora polyrhachis]
MAIEYQLTLAGDIPLEQIASLAAPQATEAPPLPGYPRLFSAALEDECGYAISITAGNHGYYEAKDDDGSSWEWEPEAYIDIIFRLPKDDLTRKGVPNMVATVGRILAARPEDAALTLNGDWLLLTRIQGRIHKYNKAEWYNESYNELFK